MAPQGVLVDQAVMAKCASDFNETSVHIQELMTRLDAEVNSCIGATQHFNGSARLAFDQNKMLLDDRITKARHELVVIADNINQVMTQHAGLSHDQGVKYNQAAQGVAAGGTIATGLG